MDTKALVLIGGRVRGALNSIGALPGSILDDEKVTALGVSEVSLLDNVSSVLTLHHLDHVNIQTKLIEETCRFYEEVLGLVRGPHPPSASAWLYLGDHPVLHLVATAHDEEHSSSPKSGCVDHIAFSAVGLSDLIGRLDRRGLAYELSPGENRSQVFFRDPNGLRVEMSFSDLPDLVATNSRKI